MNKNRILVLLSLSTFFGWLLSFPFNGPILYFLASGQDVNASYLGLVFTIFHALSFLFSAIILKDNRIKKTAMLLSAALCLILSSGMVFVDYKYWYIFMAIMGAVSPIYILGWAYYYSSMIVVKDRIKFMASVILLSNVIYYLVSILITKINPYVLFAFSQIVLLIGIILTKYIREDEYPNEYYKSFENRLFPSKLVLVVAVFVFCIYLNGGFMYHIIYPYYRDFESVSMYYRTIPYVLMLILIYFIGNKIGRILPIFFGISLIGMSFLSFAIFESTLHGYLVTETLLQCSFAIFDLFFWVLIGDIAFLYGQHNKIFGFILFSNVFPIFLGGIMSFRLTETGKGYPVITGFSAASIVFLVLLLIPLMNKYLTSYVYVDSEPKNIKEDYSKKNINKQTDYEIPNIKSLTPRELEIIELLIKGDSNKEIARKLYISENTLKIHTRHIYKKINVNNRKELLKLILNLKEDTYDDKIDV